MSNSNSSFSLYTYKDDDQRLSYFLISNRSQEGHLFTALKQADFILIIEGGLKKQLKEILLSSVRSIPKVLTAFEIKYAELKKPESFLIDLELHIMQINKEFKQNKKPKF